jgi:hypothetical protein
VNDRADEEEELHLEKVRMLILGVPKKCEARRYGKEYGER